MGCLLGSGSSKMASATLLSSSTTFLTANTLASTGLVAEDVAPEEAPPPLASAGSSWIEKDGLLGVMAATMAAAEDFCGLILAWLHLPGFSVFSLLVLAANGMLPPAALVPGSEGFWGASS